MRFTWSTEDSGQNGWDGQEANSSAQLPHLYRLRPRLTMLLLAGVGLLLGTLSMHQLMERVDQREESLAGDVLTVYTLARQAAVAHDGELFATLLDAGPPRWQAAQAQLLAQQVALAPPFPNWRPATTSPMRVTLAADHRTATLTLERKYTVIVRGVAQTATLAHSLPLSQVSGRWLFTTSTLAAAGSRMSQGRFLTLTYPLADRPMAQRLHRYLERKIGRYCRATAGVHCPSDLQINLILNDDRLHLDYLTTPFAGHLYAPQAITLPTPALVGQPMDEASEQMLFAVYGAYVVTAVNHELLEQADGRYFFSRLLNYAALDEQLAALGLPSVIHGREWPPQTLPDSLAGYAHYWYDLDGSHRTADCLTCVRPLLDFLHSIQPDLTAFDMQLQLRRTTEFEAWLQAVSRRDALTLEKNWQQYTINFDS